MKCYSVYPVRFNDFNKDDFFLKVSLNSVKHIIKRNKNLPILTSISFLNTNYLITLTLKVAHFRRAINLYNPVICNSPVEITQLEIHFIIMENKCNQFQFCSIDFNKSYWLIF